MIQIAKYKYVGNKNPHTDYTIELILAVDAAGNPTRVLGQGGEEELSDAEYESLSERYNLVRVQDKENSPVVSPPPQKDNDK